MAKRRLARIVVISAAVVVSQCALVTIKVSEHVNPRGLRFTPNPVTAG